MGVRSNDQSLAHIDSWVQKFSLLRTRESREATAPSCRARRQMEGLRGGMWTSILLMLVVTASHCFESNAALSSDGVALLALKSSIVDDEGVLLDWVESSQTPCNWTGVACDALGNVISLSLSRMNLSGAISGVIGSLKHLTTLSLDANNFTGPIPDDISELTRLRFFNITKNLFSDGFPAGFANLTKLEVLDCYNNNMSGKLPLQIVGLRNLKKVHLGGNSFDGSIPVEYGSFGQNLEYLSLSGNSLTGAIPRELGNLTGLTQLFLGYFNEFDGSIPPELGQLTNLQLLDIPSCGLTGSIPKELGNLRNLQSLFLYGNFLSGSLPPELGSLSNLLSLDVSSNQLSGPIPASFGGLANVTLISLFRNFLEGEIPAALGDLPALEVFNMWENNLTGPIPASMGRSGRLIYLDVSSNQLTGTLPPDLCRGGRLTNLIVMDNRLIGPVPPGLAACASLEYVRMHDNFLNGTVPAQFFNLRNVTMLQLNNNYFTGPLPATMTAPMLRVLMLSSNQLVGTVPEAVGGLAALQTLQAADNQLTGYIPSTICDIPALSVLDLSVNYLMGSIPATLANCSSLSRLDLSKNDLVGAIPPELVQLSVIAILNLSRNHLTGSIPERFGLIQSLTQVDFSYNNLSGPVPTLGEAEYYSYEAFEGNPLLCGGAVLAPCSERDAPASNGTGRGAGAAKGNPDLLAWLVGALFSAALVVLLVGMCCFVKKYRHFIAKVLRKEGKIRPWKLTPFQRLEFTANELVECLSDENIIGRGGAGTVYKGEMASGEMVAVKRLACGRGTSSHDHGFSAEIRTLGKIRHRNIVRLLGFCTNNEMNLLVYEYMPNGSLGEFLHGKKSGVLDWNMRYSIAVQAAHGLCYLHHDCSPLIVHRDVKSNNILLDSNLEAHVADFGLAKLFQDSGKSESMSSIAGSYGYIAPEYAYTLKVNEKSDIYSFGVVLMELLTGKRPIEPEFGDGVDIVQWVRTKIQTKEGVMEILDPRVGGVTVPLQEVMLVLRVALLCSGDHPIDRPTMRDVVQMLSDVRPTVRTGSMDSRELKPQQILLTDDLLTF
ncbi:protein MpCLV1 [Marchantia polymorpha subsp. ruderalis]|uniref:non-specific serine/threonine protein kinase n=2 Tax=Marchantia polymorpha TaxID=3197 RepID=A0AAF6AUY6_MARPO|nr:hypothetical protein MARPO_0002s0106 [Marchantia polymorpha]BBN00257.1 hypothetical protein Mp_1g27720 [Marchantia polymorpha subsp. ruderalis]|eukprot:PTQ49626.1 hypothetical protein MARPO_0002s0106 [Marchantia polymorpha]